MRGSWRARLRGTPPRFAAWAMRPSFADEIFGFHVQQAAEKLLKAWLASRGETYPLSHDLAALLDMLNAGGADVARFGGLVDYTRYAVRLRYAPTDAGTDPLDRRQAIDLVEALARGGPAPVGAKPEAGG